MLNNILDVQIKLWDDVKGF